MRLRLLNVIHLLTLTVGLNACGLETKSNSSPGQSFIGSYVGYLNTGSICSYYTKLNLEGRSGTFEMHTALCIPFHESGRVKIEGNTLTLITDQSQLIGRYLISRSSENLILKDTDKGDSAEFTLQSE